MGNNNAIFCPNCGKENETGDKYCGNCGSRLEAAAEHPKVSEPHFPVTTKAEAPDNNVVRFVNNDITAASADAGKGHATASLVLGIIAVVCWFFGYSAIISLICGFIGLTLAGKAKAEGNDSGMRTAGFVLSLIGLLGGAVVLVACVACVGSLGMLGVSV